MFCPECGRQVPEGADFCPGCGRYVNSGYTAVQVPPETPTVTYDEPFYTAVPPKQGMSSKTIAVIIVALVVAAVVLLPFLNQEEEGELSGKSFSESFDGDPSEYTGKYYEWEYLGGEFSCTLGIKNTDYPRIPYVSPMARDVVYWADSVDFVEYDNVTVSYAVSTLSKLYKQAFGTDPALDQKYADFILAFVQGSISYMTDQNQYGYSEYFTYPVETLYTKKGDCEDTAILCAALYKKAGFDSALLLMPGHMMAGVVLSEYSTPSDIEDGEILKQTIGGKTFYACETTTDSFQPVGVSYGTSGGHNFSYYLNHGLIGQGAYTFYEVSP